MTERDLERVKKAVIRRYRISAGLALHGVKLELDKNIETAAVIGKPNEKGKIDIEKISINPDFFDRLSFSERVFVLAHEALHIAFKHFSRSIEKPVADAKRKYEEYCKTELDENKRKLKEIALHNHYQNIWNIATDACINAFLKKDGFTYPKNVIDLKTGKEMQFVDIPDGLIKSAEKIYDSLIKKEEDNRNIEENNNSEEKESSSKNDNVHSSDNKNDSEESTLNSSSNNNDNSNDENNNSNNINNDSSQTGTSIDDIDIDNYKGFDSHEHWVENKSINNNIFDKIDNVEENIEDILNEDKDKRYLDNLDKENKDNEKAIEEKEYEINEEYIDEEKIMTKELEERNKTDGNPETIKDALSKMRNKNGLKEIVPYKPILSWKRLLVGTLEKQVEGWGNRRASRFNPNPRIQERTEEERPSVEIILDVSGSISVELLRGFLSQLYPIFQAIFDEENLTMKVGTFSTSFSGFQEIKTKKDIAKFDTSTGGGTNFELAATSFTPDPGRKTIKIVFTDGELGTPQQTRVPDIIWIVFGKKMNFTPIGGRIIHVSEKEYKDMLDNKYLNGQNEFNKKL